MLARQPFQPAACGQKRGGMIRSRVVVEAKCFSRTTASSSERQQQHAAPHPLQRVTAVVLSGLASASLLLPGRTNLKPHSCWPMSEHNKVKCVWQPGRLLVRVDGSTAWGALHTLLDAHLSNTHIPVAPTRCCHGQVGAREPPGPAAQGVHHRD